MGNLSEARKNAGVAIGTRVIVARGYCGACYNYMMGYYGWALHLTAESSGK